MFDGGGALCEGQQAGHGVAFADKVVEGLGHLLFSEKLAGSFVSEQGCTEGYAERSPPPVRNIGPLIPSLQQDFSGDNSGYGATRRVAAQHQLLSREALSSQHGLGKRGLLLTIQ